LAGINFARSITASVVLGNPETKICRREKLLHRRVDLTGDMKVILE
jgi:hypothetical protein